MVVVGEDSHVCGLIALEDTRRLEAAPTVVELQRLGLRRLAMLTGDNRETAAALAREVGIGEVHAGLLPEDKIAVLDDLRAGGGGTPVPGSRSPGRPGRVGFVGDGINDAPALAAADLGIAMGEGASHAAIDTADVALLSSDLTRIPWLVRHSRRVVGVIRANIAFALAVKAVFVVLTATGHASLWAAITADMGASLLAIANSLRLLRSQ